MSVRGRVHLMAFSGLVAGLDSGRRLRTRRAATGWAVCVFRVAGNQDRCAWSRNIGLNHDQTCVRDAEAEHEGYV